MLPVNAPEEERNNGVQNRGNRRQRTGLCSKTPACRITSTDDLLKLCCDANGRKATAEKTGLKESQLLKWANMADLMRTSGVGAVYSELLEAAGVDTVKELRNRRADNLAAKMAEVNASKKLTRAVPSEKVVSGWIEQAKTLKPRSTTDHTGSDGFDSDSVFARCTPLWSATPRCGNISLRMRRRPSRSDTLP